MNIKFFLLLPIIELILFILSGDVLGFFPVIIFIFASGICGVYLIRSGLNFQGIKDISENPEEWIIKKIAGILLIIPGFVTDLVGIIILIKSLRFLVWDFIPRNAKDYVYKKNRKNKNEEIIEVDYKDLDEK